MTAATDSSIIGGIHTQAARTVDHKLRHGWPWVRLSIVSILFTLHVAVTLFVTQPGHLSIDEGVYHQMASAFAQSGSLSVWNGYEEFPSDELKHPVHVVHDGKLYPQYPYLTAVVAWPFYEMIGYRGLFVMNAIAYVAVALLCFMTTRKAFGDVALALDSVIILTLATFAWQYSQAAWPHALSLMFITTAIYCTVRALSADTPGSDTRWALAAGLALGIGTGVRLDVIFAVPAIMLPYLFLARPNPRPAAAALIGLVPGLAALAATNYMKFGVLSPFSYGAAGTGGRELARYLPVLVLGISGIAALWALSRPRVRQWLRLNPATAVLAVVFVAAGLYLVPQSGDAIRKFGAGGLRLLVDFRLYRAPTIEPGMSLTADGAVVYFNCLKKALLQSIPWLPLLALPFAAFLRSGQPHRMLGALYILGASYLTFYSYYAWHGGLSLNLRYFVPTLVPFAILGSLALRELSLNTPTFWRLAASAAAPTALVVAIYLVYRNPEPAAVEMPLLTVPLVLCGLLPILLIGRAITTGRARTAMAGTSLVCATIAMGWGSASTIAYDAPMTAGLRKIYAEKANAAKPYLTPDSILFTRFEDPYFGVYDLDRIRLAATGRDDFAGFRPLLEYELKAGRKVYLALGEEDLKVAHERGLLSGLSVHALSDQISSVDFAASNSESAMGGQQE